jgi:hypothetical protein
VSDHTDTTNEFKIGGDMRCLPLSFAAAIATAAPASAEPLVIAS